MNTVFVRSPYNYDRRAASEETALKIPLSDEDRTQQHFKDECDINTIMKRFGVTGEAPPMMPGGYGDFTEVTDYQSALNAVREAGEAFMNLPSALRKRFGHDPASFLEFVHDNRNYPEAQRLGLVPLPDPVIEAPAEAPPKAPETPPKAS